MAIAESTSGAGKLEAQPLYVKVREALVGRLIGGEWKPGQMIPSEFAIAAELGVSQGTVRKSLDEMTHAGLLVRKQGRGTFVSESEDKSVLFRFFRLTADNAQGDRAAFPDSAFLSQEKRQATPEELAQLSLEGPAEIIAFERIRIENETPILWERLTLPHARFPGLAEENNLPNNVYQLYSIRYGVMVERVTEKLKAVLASKKIGQLLGVEEGAPLLQIDRRAIALDGSIVEWRVSLCRSDTIHYRNEL